MSYYSSKGDRSMTQLFEAYQTIGEKKNPEVIEEALPALAMGAAKLAPRIVKGAKAIAPVAKTVAKQIGGAAVAGAAQGAQERAKNFVGGNKPNQEQEEVNRANQEGDPIRDEDAEEGYIGAYVDIADERGGGTGEIVGVVSNPADTYVIQTDDDELLHLHIDDIMVIANQSAEVDMEDQTLTTGRLPVAP
tara:strand:+ start:2608 stop:3180 length:573 start_codon:yes stop_codon:yes gene_type:complete